MYLFGVSRWTRLRICFVWHDIIPTHNSTFAEIAMCRMIYEISCFRNPQKVYGLMDGSVIALLNVALVLDNARKVVFQGKNKVHASPYFTQFFPYAPGFSQN